MVKNSLILLCLLASPLFGQSANGVEIIIETPENVVAGNEFPVDVTFNKGNLSDYSRFSQDLPEGFTAVNVSTPNADFTFDENENRLRIIWLKMPGDDVLTVQYMVQVNESLKGELELGGSFAYVDRGERKFFNVEDTRTVNILPNPELHPSEVIAIEDFGKVPEGFDQTDPVTANRQTEASGSETTTQTTKSNRSTTAGQASSTGQSTSDGQYAMVIRQKPIVQSNGIVLVYLLVTNPEGSKFLKLEEKIPGGYSFEAVDAHGGIVSQAASFAKFVWMTPPREKFFSVSYRLLPILEESQSPLNLRGSLGYSRDNKMQEVEIMELDADIISMNQVQKASLMETGKVPDASELNTSVVTQRSPDQDVRQVTTTVPVKNARAATKTVRTTGRGLISIPDLEPGSGTYFRVQISAVRSPYYANTYFAGFDLLDDVRQEQLDGWTKYTVGEFTSYSEARAFKKKLASLSVVDQPFVVAYRDGKRISVAEAVK